MSRAFCRDCAHISRHPDGSHGRRCTRPVGKPDLVDGTRCNAGWAAEERGWSLFRDTCGPDAKYFEPYTWGEQQ